MGAFQELSERTRVYISESLWERGIQPGSHTFDPRCSRQAFSSHRDHCRQFTHNHRVSIKTDLYIVSSIVLTRLISLVKSIQSGMFCSRYKPTNLQQSEPPWIFLQLLCQKYTQKYYDRFIESHSWECWANRKLEVGDRLSCSRFLSLKPFWRLSGNFHGDECGAIQAATWINPNLQFL